ncbi:4-hydroxythreonine-4-phosphate dehydrogenase [Candidatus Riesia sp. GBBU]|nr:4-hydroxythreonine-4-phosphate dehydrogenase [Candidatus Riesia sp. GBBU]
MIKSQNKVVITAGEPAGIGPDIVIQVLQKQWPVKIVICADPYLLKDRAKQIGLNISFSIYDRKIDCGPVSVLPSYTSSIVKAGQINKKNSKYVIETINKAFNGCMNGEFSAMINGPVHKGIINDSGIKFVGHTEFLAQKSNIKKPVMLLTNKNLRVALVTTHIPIKEVSNEINYINLKNTIKVLNNSLKSMFKIRSPVIYVCGLNPHSGEDGYIGIEEIEIIKPVIETMKNKGVNIHGPFSADTIFQSENLKVADVILAMYHDQGLPVIKSFGFGETVNITLGLPFLRVSVDHGVAINKAGTGLSNCKSMFYSIKTAIEIKNNEQK